MSAWADRATSDPIANAELRNQIMKPIEVPVLGTIGIAVAVLCFSRIFLTVSKSWAIWLAVILSAVVFLGALAFALAEKVNRNLLASVLAFGAIALLTTGIVSATVGEREIAHHHGSEHGDEHGDDHGDDHGGEG